ncbi:MAG: DUF5329 family protein [Deltaproteobacteria bacterium]|jgi:hypothetical protein|nr:DUF5329 family protein [Deltaproteobacteria bacterium]
MILKFTVLFLTLTLSIFFLAASAEALPPAEAQRVEKFLTALSQEKDLVFIRNGSEYPASRAVRHLRRKLKSSQDKLRTADEFIDQVASKSSLSGKPYLIRQKDGVKEEAGPYFHKLLAASD